ncbi:unnamed protein product [Alopecurus aequalis]
MARDDGSGFCGFAKGFLVRGGSLSDRVPLANNPGCGKTVPPPEVVEISSDEEEEDGSTPVARKLRFDDALDGEATEGCDLVVEKKKSKSCGVGVGEEDDDCVVLDGDPDGAVAVGEEKGSAGFDGSLDELRIVAEKGQVACRDFPHSRHLCSKLPFITTSHVKHCSMCYCFVCDAPAPCNYWGKGLSNDDHCHGTDKEMRWKILRQIFKGALPASHSEKQQNVAYPAMAQHRQEDIQRRISAPQSDPSFLSGFSHFSLTNGSPLLNTVHQSQQRHTSGVIPNAGQTVGAPRAPPLTRDGRGRDNAHTTRATHPHTPCRQEPYQQEEDEEYTSEEEHSYTSEEEDDYTSEKVKLYVGNLHHDIVSYELVELFGQAGFVEVSEVNCSRRTGQSRGFGMVTMSTVDEAELAVKMFHGFKMRGRPLTVHKAAPRAARVEVPPRRSESSFKIYVGNLPSHVGGTWLEELFSKHGEVVEARVLKEHSGWTWRSRGFGFVKMATEEEM